MHQVDLDNGISYECKSDQTLFEAARANGVFLDHSCLSARCSSCKVKVTQGHTVNVHEESILNEEERDQGYVLSCNAIPHSDIKMEAQTLTGYELQKPKTIPAKISSIELVTATVMKLGLRTPPRQKLEFLAGQYVDIIKGDVRRAYSIANDQNTDGSIDFLIKNYEGGVMSSYLFKDATVGDLLRIEGPKGTFFLRNTAVENIVFLATGTGIAPVKAILEQIKKAPSIVDGKNVYVFWGARTEQDFYDISILSEDWLHFYPVLSRPGEDWNGSTGYVQDVALQILSKFEDSEVYACGSNTMIDSAQELLVTNGLERSRFHADAFVQTN